MKQEYIQSSAAVLQKLGVTADGLSSADAKKRQNSMAPTS